MNLRQMTGLPGRVYGRFQPGIWVITVIQLFTFTGFSICTPFLSLYLHQDRGMSMTLVGTIILAGGLCSAATQLAGGTLSDRYGRRPTLLITTIVSVLFYAGLAGVIGMSSPIAMIIVFFIISRSVSTMIRPIMAAMVADLVSKDRLTEAYGLLRVGANVGWAAGPALGGYLLTILPYSWLFAVAALTFLIALVIIKFFIKETSSVTGQRIDIHSMLSVVNDRFFLKFVILSMLLFFLMGQLGSTLSIFTVDRIGFSTIQYGLLLTVNGLIVICFQYPIARSLSQGKIYQALILGGILYGIGYLSLSWISSFNLVLVAIAVVTAGEIIFSPAALSVVGEIAPKEQRGRYMGFFGLSQIAGISLAALIGGVLLDVFPNDYLLIWGPIAMFGFAAAIGFRQLNRSGRTSE